MGLLCVGKLRFVLHALHQQQRVGAVLHGEGGILFQHLIYGIIDGGRLGQHGLRLGLGRKAGQYIIILRQRDAVCFQLCPGFRGHAGCVDEQHRPVRGHVAVGHGVGGALDVHGAQVQQPCQIVQLAHELRGAAQFPEPAAQLFQLLGRGEARVLLRQDPCRGVRQGGAVLGPQLVLKAQRPDGSALFLQCFFQAVHEGRAGGQAAQAQHLPLVQGIGTVFLHGGHTRFPHALQLDLGTGKLFFRLHEVPSIGPQSAPGMGDDKVGVLAVEPGEPDQAGVVGGQVLTGMGVSHRDQINSHAVCGHGGTQRGKALGYGIHAHNDSFLFSMAGPPEKPPAAGNFSVSYCIIPGKRLQCRGVRTLSVIAARCHLPRKGEVLLHLSADGKKLPLSGTTFPGRGKMAKPERGTAGERSEPERVGVLSAKPSGFD